MWQALRESARAGDPDAKPIVLRMMAEHEAYEALIAAEMLETAGRLDLDSSSLERHAASAVDASEWLAAAAERVSRT